MTLTEPSNTALPELFRDEVFRIETRRLWLRWPTAADAAGLAEIAAVAACAHQGARWPLGWDGHVGSIGELVQRMRAANLSGEGVFVGLADKAWPSQIIGLAGIDMTVTDGPSLGFLLDVRRQGFGVMTEATRALVEAAFRYSYLCSMRGDATMFGIGARRVLEKCGLRSQHAQDGATPRCDSWVAHRADVLAWINRKGQEVQPGDNSDATSKAA